MNTTTIESTGALCSGRRITRSIATPRRKENSTTTGRAIQNGHTEFEQLPADKALNIDSSP